MDHGATVEEEIDCLNETIRISAQTDGGHRVVLAGGRPSDRSSHECHVPFQKKRNPRNSLYRQSVPSIGKATMAMPFEEPIGQARSEGRRRDETIRGRVPHRENVLTPQLINDVERLLIFLLNPRWNGPGKVTCRLHHRELTVKCSGEWPHPRTIFTYYDKFPFSLAYGSA